MAVYDELEEDELDALLSNCFGEDASIFTKTDCYVMTLDITSLDIETPYACKIIQIRSELLTQAD